MRKAIIIIDQQVAGLLSQDDYGYQFVYDAAYTSRSDARPISLTLPIRESPFTSNILFPFFDGLIPEGWLLDIAEQAWKVSPRDRMGLLLVCCRDCIGAVSVCEVLEEEQS